MEPVARLTTMKRLLWVTAILLAGCSQPAPEPPASSNNPAPETSSSTTGQAPQSNSNSSVSTSPPDRTPPEATTPNLPARAGAEADLVGKWAGTDIQGDLSIQFTP